MNLLEKRIERLAFEYFTEMGLHPSLVQFKIKELELCFTRGYNTRAEILSLIKTAKGE
jgi:hypothetical protein